MTEIKEPKYPKGIDAKRNIFNVSVKLINDKGYNETTIKDICKAADIGTGTFYHYFKSKQDVLIECVKMESEDIIDYYKSLPQDSHFQNLIKIVLYQLNYIDFKGREFVKNVLAVELLNNIAILGASNYSAYNLAVDCLSKGQASKEFSSAYSAEFMAEMIIYSITGYVHSWIKYTDKNMKDYCFDSIKKLINMFKA